MAKTVNDELLHKTVDHSIDRERYGNGVVLRMIKILNKADKHLFAALTDALQRLPQESFTVQRLNALLKDVRALNAEVYKSLQKAVETELKSLVEYETKNQIDLFKHVLPVQVSVASVTPDVVYAAAMARPFQVSKNGAVPLNEYLQGLSADRAAKIRDAVRLGYVTGQTTDQIVRGIVGTKTQNYADGLMNIPRRYVEGMVRTAISHTSNFARQEFYKANSEIMNGYVWVSTLDQSTSDICQSLDGKVFPVGDGPLPPAHIGCRSSTAGVVKSWRDLNIDLPERDTGTRASMDGQVSAKLTYQTWLEKQSASRQDEILGVTKGKLFRAGATVDKFVDNKGRTLNLDQLRKRDAELFTKAGL